MALVNIAIRDRIAVAPAGVELVCNNPTDSIRFDFDDEWNDVSGKTARFSWEGKYVEVSFIGDTVKVPEIYKTDYVYVGVYGADIATTPVKLLCKRSILCYGDTVRAPLSDPFYEEFCDRINAAEEMVNEMQEVIDSTYTYLEDGGSPLNIPGNAGTATKLHTPAKIGEASFDGSSDITLDDMGAASENHTHTPDEIGAAHKDHTHTPEEIGAAAADHAHDDYAASSHNHSASNITSGTLPVARGGTGNTSVDTTPTSGSTKMVTSGGVHTALSKKANSSHDQAASTITEGTLGGKVVANASAVATLADAQVRNIKVSTTDLTDGTSSLTTGDFYAVY